MMRRTALVVLILLATTIRANDIVGRWRGTSICVKIESNRACHDEEVLYTFAPSPDDPKRTRLNAEKTRAGQRGVWSYAIERKVMTGTCTMDPQKTVVRNVLVRRVQ